MTFLFGKFLGDFSLFLFRSYAQQVGSEISRLCVADKYVMAIMPLWLATFLVPLNGVHVEITTL